MAAGLTLSLQQAVGESGFSTYQWSPVKGASYYRGEVHRPDGSFKFMTRSTRLVFPNNFKVGPIKALNNGALLGEIQPVVVEPKTSTASKSRSEAAFFDVDDPPSSLPYWEKRALQPGGNAAAVEVAKESGPRGYWGGRLTLGREHLKATGGLSDLDADSIAGGSGFELELHMAPPAESRLFYTVALESHNFRVELVEDSRSLGTTTSEIESHRFYTGSACVYYRVLGNGGHSTFGDLGLGGGLGVSQVAMLAIRDPAVGTSSLTSVVVKGPVLGAHHSRLMGLNGRWVTQVESLPKALGATTLQRFSAETAFQYPISEELLMSSGVRILNQAAKQSLLCPEDAPDCLSTSQITSALRQLWLGIFYRF